MLPFNQEVVVSCDPVPCIQSTCRSICGIGHTAEEVLSSNLARVIAIPKIPGMYAHCHSSHVFNVRMLQNATHKWFHKYGVNIHLHTLLFPMTRIYKHGHTIEVFHLHFSLIPPTPLLPPQCVLDLKCSHIAYLWS